MNIIGFLLLLHSLIITIRIRSNVSAFQTLLLLSKKASILTNKNSWKRATTNNNKNHLKMVQGVVIDDIGCLINTNPATGDVISKVKCSTPEEVQDMITKANNVQTKWAYDYSSKDRIDLLKKALKEELTKVSNDCIKMMIKEMGKPLSEAKEELEFAVDKDEYFDILSQALEPKIHGSSTVYRSPFGVVAILSPWNFPVDEILLLALPSLASGNTVIVKPSEVVPETGALVVQALQKVLPDGVIQLAQGDGKVGEQLVNDPNVHLIAMTGSSATGSKILQSASKQFKRVVLEMGGKDPMIVFGDSNLQKAANDAVAFSLANTGQVCCSIERIYVAEDVYDQFQSLTKDVAKQYKVGNGEDESTKVGPMVSQRQRDLVYEQVENAKSKGAKVLYESPIPDEKSGSYFPVTVLADVTEEMELFTKETFGPVVAISKFDGSESEAVCLANKTEYGLGSSVYTKDIPKAQRIAAKIQSGQVGINCYPLDNMSVHCPWVGHKHSGFGFHSGIDGFHQFSIPKSVVMAEEEEAGDDSK